MKHDLFGRTILQRCAADGKHLTAAGARFFA